MRPRRHRHAGTAAGATAVAAAIVAAALRLTTSAGLFQGDSIAFDADGTLRRSCASIARSWRRAEAPAVVLSGSRSPRGLAFDASGNLWVANLDGQSVVAFSPAQLGASGAPVPNVTLAPTSSGRPVLPVGLAFDGEGGLWVVSGVGGIFLYDRSVLGASGAPVLRVELAIQGIRCSGAPCSGRDRRGCRSTEVGSLIPVVATHDWERRSRAPDRPVTRARTRMSESDRRMVASAAHPVVLRIPASTPDHRTLAADTREKAP